MKGIWTMARLDLAVLRRSPWGIAAAIIPAAGMLVLVKLLTVAVTAQPVALVVADRSYQAHVMAKILKADTDSYLLRVVKKPEKAQHLLEQQKVAATIVIPEGFGRGVARGNAELHFWLNNVNIDIADDIRRSVDRSVVQFDAPQFGSSAAPGAGAGAGLAVPNPYRVDITETDLRRTDVSFDLYQVLPVLLLLVIALGILCGALLGSRDRERGTHIFLELSPLRRSSFVVGRLLGTLLTMFAVLVPVVLYLTWKGTIAPPRGHWPPFLAILASTAVLSAAVGALLGIVLHKASTVALAAVTIASYLFFLGGGFTTIAFLPAWLRTLSRAVPTRYAIDGMRQTLFYPDLKGVTVDLVVLCMFAGVAVLAGVFALGRRTA